MISNFSGHRHIQSIFIKVINASVHDLILPLIKVHNSIQLSIFTMACLDRNSIGIWHLVVSPGCSLSHLSFILCVHACQIKFIFLLLFFEVLRQCRLEDLLFIIEIAVVCQLSKSIFFKRLSLISHFFV